MCGLTHRAVQEPVCREREGEREDDGGRGEREDGGGGRGGEERGGIRGYLM